MSLSMPADATPDQLTAADLSACLPATAEVVGGRLLVGGVDLARLAEREGTPLYVYDEADLRGRMRAYRESFSACSDRLPAGADVVYAGKAFLDKAMVRLVDEEGLCLDVSGGGELAIALAAGFDAARVVVHGNNKTPAELAEAIAAGVGRIVVDNSAELARVSAAAVKAGVTQDILLRITPGIHVDTNDYVVTGCEDSKFGFTLLDDVAFRAVGMALDTPGVRLVGVHMHVGSQVLDVRPYRQAIDVMCDLLVRVRDAYGVELAQFDLGGGLGVAYDAAERPTSVEDFVAFLVDGVREACAERGLAVPHLAVEPGRSIAAVAGVALYRVGAVKPLPGIRTYVAVDGGMSDDIRCALYGSTYECLLPERADEPRDCVVTVCGKHCESGDVIVRDASLPEPHEGDVLAVLGTGAYCCSMASNYNGQPRPAVVFVADGEARVVTRRETYEDLLRRDVG